MTIRVTTLQAVLALVLACPITSAAQDSLSTAQALYASASYDEALAVIDRLSVDVLSPREVLALNQQRALCLLALGRAAEAETAIAAIVHADPTYRPDASPRVRQAFRDVRARLLPAIVQAEYAEARKLYDADAWAEAAARFERVVALTRDADLSAEQAAPLADVKVLAEGFATLAAKAAAPPPPPAPAEAPAPEPGPPPRDYDAVYDGTEPGVSGPVTIVQALPRWPGGRPVPTNMGLLEVVIGKNGIVESAAMRQRVASFYDRQVLEAVVAWKYDPAQLDGQPVRFRKTIKIAFR